MSETSSVPSEEEVAVSTEEAPQAAAAEAPETAAGEDGPWMRTLIAIGDLHGDFHRFVRLMRESDLLLPGTFAWNPDQTHIDLILIGDYVDWRLEPLEGPSEEWPLGARKILELMYSLHRELDQLREADPKFQSRLYTVLGNHDEMMLEAHGIFNLLDVEDLENFLNSVGHTIQVKQAIQSLGLGPGQVEKVLKFLNWYVQGGQATIEGYEGLRHWKEALDGEMGNFLREYLRLGVVVNNRLFAHTVPDYREFWRPIEEIVGLPDSTYKRAKEAFLWSRKVWGYDYCTGSRTAPFSSEEIDEMLMGMAVEGMVVGHTPLPHEGKPVIAHGGRVINIDLHAYPGSEALIQSYRPTENGTSAPLRSPSLSR